MILGTGVDITEVNRLKKAIEKWGNAFLSRVFTPAEINNARKRVSYYQHLAGRFAAKEAVFKAVGDKDLGWQDLEIMNDEDGKPYCVFLGKRGESLDVHISISHVKNYAVANAVAEKKS